MVQFCKYCLKKGGSQATNQGRTLHRFPLDDPALLETWRENLKFKPSFRPSKHTRICSDHFEKHCFQYFTKRRVLVAGSVPTLFADRKRSCFYCKASRETNPGISLRKFPFHRPKHLKKWLLAINIADFIPNKETYICSDHFAKSCFHEIKGTKYFNLRDSAVPTIFTDTNKGKSAQLFDVHNPDWVPSLNLGYPKRTNTLSISMQRRNERAIRRAGKPSSLKNVEIVNDLLVSRSRSANLMDTKNPDWVPSLHLGYEISKKTQLSFDNYKISTVTKILRNRSQSKASRAPPAAEASETFKTETESNLEEEFLQDALEEAMPESSTDSIAPPVAEALEAVSKMEAESILEEEFLQDALEEATSESSNDSIGKGLGTHNIPINCCVPHCKNVRNKGQSKYKFFRFPNAGENSNGKVYRSERQAAWIKAINRIDITPLNASCKIICSEHFMLGYPAKFRDKSHPDWVPNKNLPTTLTKAVKRNKCELKNNFLNIETIETDLFDPLAEEEIPVQEVLPSENNVLANMKIERMEKEIRQLKQANTSLTKQLEERNSQIIDQEAELRKLNEIHKWEIKEKECVIKTLEHRYIKVSLSREGFKDDDKKVNYFTGLPSFAVLEIIYNFVKEELHSSMTKGVNSFDAFILLLLKLRLDLPMAYLGYRYGIAGNTVSHMIHSNLKALSEKIGPFIRWPEKSTLRENTPIYFKKVLGNGFTALIDFIENPGPEVSELNLIKNNYVPTKHLVAISPAGAIIFVSKGYDSTLSVKEIAESCGLLDYTDDGDIILSDHGKVAHQVFSFNGSKVLMQSLDNKDNDLLDSLLQSPVQVNNGNPAEVNNCRVYIQRSLSVLKNKFFILTNKYKLGIAKSYKSDEDCYFDYVVKVCCALVNVSPTLLSFDTKNDKNAN